MSLPTKHILHQGPVIASLGGTMLSAVLQRFRGGAPGAAATPGPEIRSTIPPRPESLVRDYVRHVGGDPGGYRGVLPPHLFPQWGFPLAARTLRGIPYPMQKVLNAGCRLEVNAPLPAGEPLVVTARLEDIDDDGRRAILHQKVVTGTASAPEAVVGHLYALVPLGGGKDKKGEKKAPARVPAGATELAYFKLRADAGLAFAMLTGDFNPVHWVPAYAKAFGFRSTILHGFATMARAIEGLNRALFAGATDRITTFDCKFTRPLLLPAQVGLYLNHERARPAEPGELGAPSLRSGASIGDHDVYVGDAPGGPAYLVGTYTTTKRSAS